jgi:GTPase SAR1 family protein
MGGQLSKALGRSFGVEVRMSIKADWGTGRLFGNKEMRILMLGLDAAGKTSKCLSTAGYGYDTIGSTVASRWRSVGRDSGWI